MTEEHLEDFRDYPADVQIVEKNGREYIIIGTAHVSQESADLVRHVVSQERPDVVCIELDEQRYKSLSEQRKWENLDLKQVIRQRQLPTLVVNLLLGAYQRRIGQRLGVMPGTELLEAAKVAKEYEIPISLVDRDVRITLRRAWASMSFWEKMNLMASGIVGATSDEEITEEMLQEIKQKDVLSELMNELGEAMPVLKSVLIDERDTYIAQKTRHSTGEKVVAVVGAGHVEGILTTLREKPDIDLSTIEEIPPPSPVGKIIGWGIPLIIIGMLAYIGFTQGASAAGDNLFYWVLANGIPAAIGAILSFAHPYTILISFFGAPLTSLTPVIGAGYVAAFVQAYFQPPVVKEFQTVSDDVSNWRMWWQNKLLRVLLVFFMTTLGSVIGTYVGAANIISNLGG